MLNEPTSVLEENPIREDKLPPFVLSRRHLLFKVARKLTPMENVCLTEGDALSLFYQREVRMSPHSACVGFSDFTSVAECPGAEFLSARLHIHQWTVTKSKRKKKRLQMTNQ